MSASWGYAEENGPQEWMNLFPQASGHKQSPIDIKTLNAKRVQDLNVAQLTWKYIPGHSKSLMNSGYCWRVDVNGDQFQLTGGPLGENIYKLEQFHCHWGNLDTMGSEHTVDGEAYSGELHLVHWNTTKYTTFGEAVSFPDGLAVIGVFLKPGNYHEEMGKITNLLPLILHKGDRITLPYVCDPSKLLPKPTSYWTYDGSLTTPPCSESVIWIIFKSPVEISNEQFDAMRNLNCYDVKEECPCNKSNGKVINNFRPPLPLGNREILEFRED